MKKVIDNTCSCTSAAWNIIGEELGYDWNEICDLMHEEELYGQDGEGCFTLPDSECIVNPILKEIANELLKQSNGKTITVIDSY